MQAQASPGAHIWFRRAIGISGIGAIINDAEKPEKTSNAGICNRENPGLQPVLAKQR